MLDARKSRIFVDVNSDAAHLPFASHCFDYLCSSHVLEHMPNTISVLEEWARVLKPGGRLVLRLPHANRTFDRIRPKTTLEHHIKDSELSVDYSDPTHWEEWEDTVSKTDGHLWKDSARQKDGSFDFQYIVRRGLIHYHVWTQNEMVRLLQYLDFTILVALDRVLDDDISFLIIAEAPTRRDRHRPNERLTE
ncbi:MAG: class I SAM-dependent methyltransferase [Candidatus Hydrogenedentes bacterium]|nr:class I SAM-dependent methyltransferase [Candidatus Hydrogenedentota bacterium]